MNILLVSNEFPPEMATGGIGSYMFHLAHLLHAYGHKVYVISETKAQFSIVDKGFCTNYLIPSGDAADFRNQALNVFEKYLTSAPIDIIESPEVLAPALSIKEKFPHIPLIVKLHTPGVLITKVSQTYTPFFSKLGFVLGSLASRKFDLGYWRRSDPKKDSDPEYRICKMANQLLSPSHALKKWIADYWSINQNKILVVANPFVVNNDLFDVPIERNTHSVCFVGKLSVLKGVIVLTQALKIFLSKFPKYHVFIIGRDENIATHTSGKNYMQKELELWKEQIHFLGQLSPAEVHIKLSIAEVSIVPSLWENFPNVVLESMAAGATVVASDVGGIPELITHGQTGLLFPAKSGKKLAKEMEYLIANPSLRYQMARNARAKVKDINDNDFQKTVLKIYEDTIKSTQ